VPGILELYPYVTADLAVFPVIERTEQAERLLGVSHCIERQGRLVLGVPLLVGPSGVFLVKVGAVFEQDFAQVAGGIGAVHVPGETLLAETGEVS
jgi:hypothetical protein